MKTNTQSFYITVPQSHELMNTTYQKNQQLPRYNESTSYIVFVLDCSYGVKHLLHDSKNDNNSR